MRLVSTCMSTAESCAEVSTCRSPEGALTTTGAPSETGHLAKREIADATSSRNGPPIIKAALRRACALRIKAALCRACALQPPIPRSFRRAHKLQRLRPNIRVIVLLCDFFQVLCQLRVVRITRGQRVDCADADSCIGVIFERMHERCADMLFVSVFFQSLERPHTHAGITIVDKRADQRLFNGFIRWFSSQHLDR